MSDVTLKVTLKAGCLDVNEDGDPNHIPRGEAKITWQLHLPRGHHGSFNTLVDPSGPGFAWKDVPTPGIFGIPDVVVRNKQITLTDDNTNPNGINSTGDWIYQLCATVDGKPYSTVYDPGARK